MSAYKKPFHRRHDSGELDVFEAARYFSGATEITSTLAPENKRMSLDMPHLRNSIPSHPHRLEKQTTEKKYKQPSSPGGRLASFLNSLFNQTIKSSKKKKSKPSTTQSVKDHEDESACGRRKRRSSISHFRSGSAPDTKSFYSSSSSGFRTPPPYVKAYKDLRSYSDHKQIVSLPKYSSTGINNIISTKPRTNDVVKRSTTSCLDDEEFKFSPNGVFPAEKLIMKGLAGVSGFSEEKGFRKFNDGDDDGGGGDSDSSSDLFELENYDLSYYSSGLPVYETTHMDSIKRGAPISSGAI